MSEASIWYANLSPESRVTAAKALPLSRFAAEQEATGLLLVSLKNESAKFIAMLSRIDDEPRDPVVSEMLDPMTRMGEPLRQTWPTELAQSFDEDALAGIVQKTLHFVAAIRKRSRSEAQDHGRITVGRAGDCDIVLSSQTVSKVHAWFEVGEDGTHWVTDKGSRNGTRVNGQRIAVDQPAGIEAGDRIEFGLVRAVFCPISIFWRALRNN
jgi:pSer/pThr/pTyr-binding forkhead associated (FHA) protein